LRFQCRVIGKTIGWLLILKTVLVVDDDPFIVKLISINLEARDYSVLTAGDGKEGLISALKNDPDLILLDLMMPVMNGLEMLKELRQVSDVPVIIVSAYGNPDTVEEARELGIECFLSKPFKIEGMVDTIDIILNIDSLSFD
jgi:DNA-binding response OmpR family regulator